MYDKTYGVFCYADNLKVFPFYIVGVSITNSHLSNIKSIVSKVDKDIINTQSYYIISKLNSYKKEYFKEDTFKIHLYKLSKYELEKYDLTYAFIKGIQKLSLPYKNRLILSSSNCINLPSSKLSINIDNYLDIPELIIGFIYSKLLRSFCLKASSKNLNKLKCIPSNSLINDQVYSILQDKSIKAYPIWLQSYIQNNYERFIE